MDSDLDEESAGVDNMDDIEKGLEGSLDDASLSSLTSKGPAKRKPEGERKRANDLTPLQFEIIKSIAGLSIFFFSKKGKKVLFG